MSTSDVRSDAAAQDPPPAVTITGSNDKGPVLGMRHVQSFLLFFAIMAIYLKRVSIGISVVAMTNAATTNPNFPEFDWDEKEISYILSSFYWGYVLTQFPGGILCKRFGVKLIMGWATFISAVLTTLIPWAVGWGGWQMFCVLRILQGLAEGVVFPCIYEHLARWSPLEERNRLGTFSLTGFDCGVVLAMAISGIIAEGSMGWPGISYVTAGMCFVWCLTWLIFGANNPHESRFISDGEKRYIESSLTHGDDFHEKKLPIPWKAIFTSTPFIMFLTVRCSELWGMTTLEAQIPSYLNGVLNMDIKSNALFSALPFLVSWVVSYVFLALGDWLRHKNILSLTGLRRVFNSIAFWIPALGLIGIGFLDEDNKSLALTLMTISVSVNSGNIIGSSLNVIDLSPNHAGLLYSISNTATSCMPLISPLVVGVVVTDVHNRSQWQIVFAIAAAVFFTGNLLYIIFGSTKTQPWDAEDFLLPKVAETPVMGRVDKERQYMEIIGMADD